MVESHSYSISTVFKKFTVPGLIFLCFLSPQSAIAVDSAGPAGNERPKSEAIISSGEDTDSTPEMETESTIDTAIEESVENRQAWVVSGDLRPILTYLDVDGSDGTRASDEDLGIRARLGVIRNLSKRFRMGAGLAGRCFSSDCDLEFILPPAPPGPNGLRSGQVTFDELYLHWFRKGAQRFDIIAGRLQTRFVLRGGVYFKSLDRNDSNNTRITWTDGLHATFRGDKGWRSNFILQRNVDEGTGSIRRGPLDFTDSAAKNTYFLGFENLQAWGPVVQRGLDLSYLPHSLIKDNAHDGRNVDYWGLVGRLAVRWPQRSEGLRFRGGVEMGYAPETPSRTASVFDDPGDVSGLAWNVVANAMDIRPGHSIGVNYGRTGKGWLLSPQYLPNSELLEFRYQWRPGRGPLLEARVRRQADLDKPVAAAQKRSEFDFYLRLTWEFGGFNTRTL